MRRFIVLYLSAILTLAVAGLAFGQTTVFRDPNGNRTGTVTREGSRDVYRDPNGNRTGSSSIESGQTVFRDRNGNRIGSATTH